MFPILFIILLCAVFVALFLRAQKNVPLNRLEFLPDEKELYRNTTASYYEQKETAPVHGLYRNKGTIIVTNKRIILARSLFGTTPRIDLVVSLETPSDLNNIRTEFTNGRLSLSRSGFMTLYAKLNEIGSHEYVGEKWIKVPTFFPGSSIGNMGTYVLVPSDKQSEQILLHKKYNPIDSPKNS